MIKKHLLIISIGLSCISHAGNMEDAHARAVSASSQFNANAMSVIRSTDTTNIETNVPELKHREELGDPEYSKAYALTQPGVHDQYEYAKDMLSTRPTINNELIVAADEISNNASQYSQADGYCRDGDCYQSETANHTDDMVKNSAALEDVLGGGASYANSGKQATIYNGKAYKCKSGDSFGNSVNCCKDKGWASDIGLANCPDEAKKLQNLKKKGLCHYVGDYDEALFDPFGIKIGKEGYDSYCCFSSEMARITHVDGRPQHHVKMSWGSGKYPNCKGFTPDQFASLDFSKIDLKPIYDDIDARVVKPVNEQMLQKPDEFYKEQGIASW